MLTPRERAASAYHLGLKLNAVGYAQLETLISPQSISTEGSTVTYQWNQNVRELWVNSQNNLEQWFVLEQRPVGADKNQKLIIQMSLDTDLAVRQNGDALSFKTPANRTISYDKLKVWDAEGHDIPASMQLADNSISLVVDDANAVYPLTIDPAVAQGGYLKASNTGKNDWFGTAVAISGDRVIVGAPYEDSNALGVDGDEANNLRPDSGAAYVFVRDGSGDWSQEAYLKPSTYNGGSSARFGFSVAISGNTAVVGAPYGRVLFIDSDGRDASASGGFVAVFVVDDFGVWTEQVILQASNAGDGDAFGISVAISGGLIVVGANGESSAATGVDGDELDDTALASGAAYVFARYDGSSWTNPTYLKASNTEAGDRFGGSVAISGDTVVVGAEFEDSNATGVPSKQSDQDNNDSLKSGAAYVFVRDAGSWSQQAYLKAFNTEMDDKFARSVSVSGDTIVVGAAYEDSNAIGVDGDEADNSMSESGAAYVYARNKRGGWQEDAYLKASDTGTGDFFGVSVAISGDAILVGAMGQDNTAFADNGAAYLFVRDGSGVWAQDDFLNAHNPSNGDFFGESVAIDADGVVIGAKREDSDDTGVGALGDNLLAPDSGAAYTTFVTVPLPPPPSPLDLDIASFSAKGRAKISSAQEISFVFKVKNMSDSSASTDATLTGVQDGNIVVPVYSETITVSDTPGGPSTSFTFPTYTPLVLGDITWTVIFTDGVGEKTATDSTKVLP